MKEGLDRFCATATWKNLFFAAKVMHLKSCKSDYIPILLEVTPAKNSMNHRLFQFEECGRTIRSVRRLYMRLGHL